MMDGILYLVGTPIGNLEDMTFRAIATLKQADLIAAEDTRRTGKLLQHFQIQTPQISYHDHNRHQRIGQLLSRLQNGTTIALVSDAGLPGISDPGHELVASAIESGITVLPIPGACAGVTGLIASGLPSARFVFEGFLPHKNRDRRERLESLAQETRTLVFYEAPHRLLQTLQELANHCGSERIVVCARELTKLHEEFWRGSLERAIAYYQTHSPKGEFTLILAGADPITHAPPSDEAIMAQLKKLIIQGMSPSKASRHLAETLKLSRRKIYQLSTILEKD